MSTSPMYNATIVIHGGAGAIPRSTDAIINEANSLPYRQAMERILHHGRQQLKAGLSALDVVQQCVELFEDDPLFNAGRGAVFTHDGHHELDASIMDGSKHQAGAVIGVKHVRHPIRLARRIMERSAHVCLAGDGAEHFARERCGLDDIEMVDNAWFSTEKRRAALQKVQQQLAESSENNNERIVLDHSADAMIPTPIADTIVKDRGTVGAVALDIFGNLAAATSTGGMTNKRYGRVGDTPVIGAGTYADNDTAAVSATGHGEMFIRSVTAHELAAAMRYGHQTLNDAAKTAIERMASMASDAEGGLIAVDRLGNVAMPFNSAGMYRGYARVHSDEMEIRVWPKELDK